MTGGFKRNIPKGELLLFLFMAGFGLLKQFLVYNLPIMAVPKGIHDDWIMVHLAETLRNGQWGCLSPCIWRCAIFFTCLT